MGVELTPHFGDLLLSHSLCRPVHRGDACGGCARWGLTFKLFLIGSM